MAWTTTNISSALTALTVNYQSIVINQRLLQMKYLEDCQSSPAELASSCSRLCVEFPRQQFGRNSRHAAAALSHDLFDPAHKRWLAYIPVAKSPMQHTAEWRYFSNITKAWPYCFFIHCWSPNRRVISLLQLCNASTKCILRDNDFCNVTLQNEWLPVKTAPHLCQNGLGPRKVKMYHSVFTNDNSSFNNSMYYAYACTTHMVIMHASEVQIYYAVCEVL